MSGFPRVVLGFAAVACLLAGCADRRATRHPQTTSQIQLTPADLHFTRIAEGEDCVTVVMGISLSHPSYQAAEQRALAGAAAEHLLNQVSSEGVERGFYLGNPFARLGAGRRPQLFVFYGQHCVYVEGHGVARRHAGQRP